MHEKTKLLSYNLKRSMFNFFPYIPLAFKSSLTESKSRRKIVNDFQIKRAQVSTKVLAKVDKQLQEEKFLKEKYFS